MLFPEPIAMARKMGLVLLPGKPGRHPALELEAGGEPPPESDDDGE